MAFVTAVVGLGHKKCCDGYMGRLRTNRVLWCLQRLAKDKKVAVVSTGIGLGQKGCYVGYRVRHRTTRVLCRLSRLAEDHKCGFCDHWGSLRTQRLL